MLRILGCTALIVVSLHATAAAGVLFHMETTSPDRPDSPPRNDSMMIEGKNLKMTIDAAGDRESTVIYRGDREEILMVDHETRSWRAMDKDTMTTLGQQMKPAMENMQRQMAEALKNMPPERRAMMEKMFARQGIDTGMLSGKIDIHVKKTGHDRTVNGYPCVTYEVWKQDDKLAEHCVTDWTRIPGGDEAREVFQGMAAFAREMWKGVFQGNANSASFFESMAHMEGYPVLTKIYSDGTLLTESRLADIKHTDVPGKEFEAPEGYIQKEILPNPKSGPAGHGKRK